jgi:hypothetical protein
MIHQYKIDLSIISCDCFLNTVCCTSDNVGNAMQSYGQKNTHKRQSQVLYSLTHP